MQNKCSPNRNHFPYHYVSDLFNFLNHALGNYSRSHTHYFIYKRETTFEMNETVLASTDGKQDAQQALGTGGVFVQVTS
jgi:hypothetical protein